MHEPDGDDRRSSLPSPPAPSYRLPIPAATVGPSPAAAELDTRVPFYPPAPAPVTDPWVDAPPPAPSAPPLSPAGFPQNDTTTYGCQICGASPAESFTFRSIVGMFLAFRRESSTGRFCGSCAQHTGRKMQSKTLLTGWWGILACVFNVGVIIGNTRKLRRAAEPRPQGEGFGRRLSADAQFSFGARHFAGVALLAIAVIGIAMYRPAATELS